MLTSRKIWHATTTHQPVEIGATLERVHADSGTKLDLQGWRRDGGHLPQTADGRVREHAGLPRPLASGFPRLPW